MYMESNWKSLSKARICIMCLLLFLFYFPMYQKKKKATTPQSQNVTLNGSTILKFVSYADTGDGLSAMSSD